MRARSIEACGKASTKFKSVCQAGAGLPCVLSMSSTASVPFTDGTVGCGTISPSRRPKASWLASSRCACPRKKITLYLNSALRIDSTVAGSSSPESRTPAISAPIRPAIGNISKLSLPFVLIACSFLFLQRAAHRAFQLIDFVVRVVQRQRRTHRGFETEAIHRRLRAVMSRAHRDAVLVEDLAHFLGWNLVGDK